MVNIDICLHNTFSTNVHIYKCQSHSSCLGEGVDIGGKTNDTKGLQTGSFCEHRRLFPSQVDGSTGSRLSVLDHVSKWICFLNSELGSYHHHHPSPISMCLCLL